MEEKGIPFLTVESQVINVEEMVEMDHHYLATMVVVGASGNRSWILKLMGGGLMRSRIVV